MSVFPTNRDPYVNGYDIFVAKFDPAGYGSADLVWSTILGGPGFDRPGGIALDAEGNIYLVGTTKHTKETYFPTTDGTTLIGTESIFMFKLSNDGYVQYCTILAEGAADDREQPDLAVSQAGFVFVTGRAMNGGDEDALVAKFSQTGNPASPLQVEYSIFLGGSSLDLGAAIEVDLSGNAYVAGRTTSTDFPTVNAYQTSLKGASDILVAKIDSAGTVVYSTYFGGNESTNVPEMGVAIAVDGSGRAYVTGITDALDFPLRNGQTQAPSGSNQAFLTVIDPLLSEDPSLIYSTRLLAGMRGRGIAVAVDASGLAYVGGSTVTSDLPTTPDALFPSHFGMHDGFLTVVDPSQSGDSSVVSLTYFGSPKNEWIQGIDLHEVGGNVKVHVTGHTGAREGFPVTPGAYQEDPIKSSEVFFSVLAWQGQGNSPPTVEISSPGDGSTFGSGATISFEGTATDTEDGDITWDLVWESDRDGTIGSGGSFPAVLSDGVHVITASVTDSGGKPGDDSSTITVGSGPQTIGLSLIEYSVSRRGDLLITCHLDAPVRRARVSIDLFRDGSPVDSYSGLTDAQGKVTFKHKKAASGTYTSVVTDVTASGYTWDGNTPLNGFTF